MRVFRCLCFVLVLFVGTALQPVAAGAAQVDIADGEYTVPIELEGGSGRASVASPADLSVENGEAKITLVWSSSNYDYMIVDGKRYEPLDGEEYSTFQIPVLSFEEPFSVIADTTAMSVPHEIEYRLRLDTDGITAVKKARMTGYAAAVGLAVAVIVIADSVYKKRK